MADIEIHRSREEAQRAAGSGAEQHGGAEPAPGPSLAAASAPGTCACGGHDEGTPELDVQTIPHAVRHSAIFGVLDGLRPGAAVVLSATHDPVPLIQQLGDRSPGLFSVDYLERGPERWRLLVHRLENALAP